MAHIETKHIQRATSRMSGKIFHTRRFRVACLVKSFIHEGSIHTSNAGSLAITAQRKSQAHQMISDSPYEISYGTSIIPAADLLGALMAGMLQLQDIVKRKDALVLKLSNQVWKPCPICQNQRQKRPLASQIGCALFNLLCRTFRILRLNCGPTSAPRPVRGIRHTFCCRLLRGS